MVAYIFVNILLDIEYQHIVDVITYCHMVVYFLSVTLLCMEINHAAMPICNNSDDMQGEIERSSSTISNLLLFAAFGVAWLVLHVVHDVLRCKATLKH
ncbi:hypothetical protein NQ317_002230 [Molorchus minor]|uniref:Uncharacterized protein n=1 Tax=Molorchus minor TaxID=1323400 RepID=A0ABQ9JDY6_9CUCU|nr:hypothetical protein NQ317_002230 [Molorchus minor]